jgi:hypothetical protein
LRCVEPTEASWEVNLFQLDTDRGPLMHNYSRCWATAVSLMALRASARTHTSLII